MSRQGTKRNEYFLVARDEIYSEPGNANDGLEPPRNGLIRHEHRIAVLCILALSLALNAFLLCKNISSCYGPDLGRSSYSTSELPSFIFSLLTFPPGGLTFDTPVIYHSTTDYWGANDTLADELWNGMDTDPIVVALWDDYAQQHGLEISGRFPWDDEKGIYFLKGFHNLHCLVNSLTAPAELTRLAD